MLGQLLGNFHPHPVEQNGSDRHFVPLDKDDSCPTADLSNIGRPNGPACLTGELLAEHASDVISRHT